MTVTVPQDSNKRKVQSNESAAHNKRQCNWRSLKGPERMRVSSPHNLCHSGGRLCHFVEGWKHIMNDPYVLSIIAKGYRLCFTSPSLLLQTLMLQKNATSEISPETLGFHLNVFLVRKASGGWRPVIDLKQLNHHIDTTHFHMHTISSVLGTVKIDLQDAYFHVLIYTDSRKYVRCAFKNKVYQFRLPLFGLNTAH